MFSVGAFRLLNSMPYCVIISQTAIPKKKTKTKMARSGPMDHTYKTANIMTIPTSIGFSVSREPQARVMCGCAVKKDRRRYCFYRKPGRAKFNCFVRIYMQMCKKCVLKIFVSILA